MKTHSGNFIIAFVFVLLGAGIAASDVLSAEVTFPVPELGNCRDQESCRKYCDEPEHLQVCVNFAERQGLIARDQAQRARRFAAIIKDGGPGGCETPEECRDYCEATAHQEECLAFAERNSLLSGQDISRARRMLSLLRDRETPGECRTSETCARYCANESHITECTEFALKSGFMTPAEIERYRRMHGRGPGGCEGRETCKAFCNNPKNLETCLNFGREFGLIRTDESERIREGTIKIREEFEELPSSAVRCLESVAGSKVVDQMRDGKLVPAPELAQKMRQCFLEVRTPRRENIQIRFEESGAQEPNEEREFSPEELQNTRGFFTEPPPTPSPTPRSSQNRFWGALLHFLGER